MPGQPGGPISEDEEKSRIKAGVTSDTRQVTSARSADRFKGFRDTPVGLLFGVSFGPQITGWCLIPSKPSRSNALGRRLQKLIRSQHEIESITALENFILGFRLGARLIAECMDENDGDIKMGGD